MSLRKRTYTVSEAAYKGNLGFSEMMQFYKTASDKEIRQMEKYIENGKDKLAWKLLKKKTGANLSRLR